MKHTLYDIYVLFRATRLGGGHLLLYESYQSMSETSMKSGSSPNQFAELQLTGIEPATLVPGPINSTTELCP